MLGPNFIPTTRFVLHAFTFTRIVSTPSALDALEIAADAVTLRLAPDELLTSDVQVSAASLSDPYAIVEPDSSWVMAWLSVQQAEALRAHYVPWHMPITASYTAPLVFQGMIAGIAVKFYLSVKGNKVMLIVPAAYQHDFEARVVLQEDPDE